MPTQLQWKDFKLHPQKTAFILGSSPSIIDEPLHLLNGKIVYLPHITRPKGSDPFVKEWKNG